MSSKLFDLTGKTAIVTGGNGGIGYGCGSAIASSGELIDMLKGKTLEEAKNISNQEIVDILELPAIKIHCSVLAEEAIHRAIDDFKSRRNND